MSDDETATEHIRRKFTAEWNDALAAAEARGRQIAAQAILDHADKYAPQDGNAAQRRLRRHLHIAARVAAGPMTHEEVAQELNRLLANQATPDTAAPRAYDYDTEGLGGT